MTIRTEQITFPGANGDPLAARLDRPLGEPLAFALFAHCFTCSKDIFAASRISRALADRGVAVLRFDFTGLGMSEGEFGNTNFSSNVGDLVAAAAYLRQAHRAPALLIGHSLGGAAVLAAAGKVPEAHAVATIGAPFDPSHVKHLLRDAEAQIEASGEACVTIGGRPFQVKKQFLDDIVSQKLSEHIASLDKALLVMHSPIDRVVEVDHARRIFEVARHPKSFMSLDDADHLLSRHVDASYVANVIAAWASRYLGEGSQPIEIEASAVVVREAGEGPFAQGIRVGRHALRADEPAALGGSDTGPSPYEYLLVALGACTSMTLRMYADRKKLPLSGITVRLAHDKVHAEDCSECESKTGKIDRIDREIELSGPLSDAERKRLMEIADKCPVHRTLGSEVVVHSRMKP